MKIDKKLNEAMNKQIGEELKASNGYASMAVYFDSLGLKRLAGMFFEQSEEEREHAFKFIHHLMDLEGEVVIPSVPAVPPSYDSVKHAFETALSWEQEVTGMINHMMDLAIDLKDYPSQVFLNWFVTEQVEEEATMSQLLNLVNALGSSSILNLEAHLPQE